MYKSKIEKPPDEPNIELTKSKMEKFQEQKHLNNIRLNYESLHMYNKHKLNPLAYLLKLC